MESIPTQPMEAMIGTSEFIQHCLGTPKVLRKILEQFSNRELLTLSLVNKQWSFEARSVLKDRGDITPKMHSFQSLAAFALDWKSARVVPFSGIHIELCHYDHKACQPPLNESIMDPSYNLALHRLRLPRNHLAVTFNMPLDTCKDCQALKLITKLLKDFQGSLEELSLTFYNKEKREMYQQVFQDWTFPRLKTLKITAYSGDESLSKFLKALVSRAPNLRTLNCNACFLFQENVLEGSSAVLVPTVEFDPIYERVCPGLISYLRAETIQLSFTDFKLEKKLLKKDISLVLEASRASLKTLRMEFLFAGPLMRYGICLENVTKLEIWMPSDLLEKIQRHMSMILTSFEFTSVFPKLQQVKIVSQCRVGLTSRQIIDFVEQGIAGLKSISPDQAVKIKHLTLRESIWDSELPFWARMFPHVETLLVNIGRTVISQFPFTILWEHFVSIKELILESIHWCSAMTADLDTVFCGIFPEEVAQLMKEDDEYLEAVNIVPVMPSITCMKALRTLKLDFTLPYRSNGHLDMKPYPKFLFSRVTALIGFARCPALIVISSKSIEQYENLSFFCH